MSIALNDNLDINAPKLIDARSKKPDGNAYASKAEVLELLPESKRDIGLPVFIGQDYYYFKTGITNESDLYLWTASVPTSVVETVTGNLVDNTDPYNPIVDLDPSTIDLSQFGNASANPFVRQTALDDKVDKIAGMGLSQESFTTAEKSKLGTVETGAQENIIERVYVDNIELPINNKSVFISLPQSDKILTVGDISTSTNILTLGVGFSWLLSGVQYQNTTTYNEVIPYTSNANMKRVDIIVANQSNTFQRIEGVESATIPTRPNRPPNTVIVTTVDVYHDSIGNPSTPTNNEFLPIDGQKWYNVSVTSDVFIPTNTTISNFRIIGLPDSTLELRGFIVDNEQTDGLVVRVWNDSDEDIEAIDSFAVGTGEVSIELPQEENVFIKPKEVYTFKLYKPNAVNLTGAKFLLVSVSGETELETFEEDITVSLSNGKTMGKYLNGETIPAQGKTFEEVLRDIAIETQFPTFVNPTFSLAHNQGTREVGVSVDLTLTANFNRGQIKGKLVAGIWQPNAEQDKRAGVADYYIIDGTNTGLTNTKNITTYVVTLGTNSFSSTVNYLIGAQPLDSSGNNYNAPYPAGDMTANAQFTGLYPYFWGVIEPNEDIEDINLSSLTKVVATSTGTITIPYSEVSSKRLVIMIPFTSNTKNVWWVNALNNGGIGNPGDLFPEEETGSYNSPDSYWSGISYKVYISEPTDLDDDIELRNN